MLSEIWSKENEEPDYAAVTQEILTEAYNNDWTGVHLQRFANIFYSWATKNKERAINAAKFCPSLMNIEIDGSKFRTPLFKQLQEDYLNRDVMRSSNKRQWLIFTTFLSKLFLYLLTDDKASEDEIQHGVEQLKDVGSMLTDCNLTAMQDLMGKVRRKIMAPSTPEVGRILLLQVLEMYSADWKLNKEAKKYYKKKLATTLET